MVLHTATRSALAVFRSTKTELASCSTVKVVERGSDPIGSSVTKERLRHLAAVFRLM